MKRAKNIEEIYRVFDYTRYLRKEDHDFFVNLYEKELKSFASALKLTKDNYKLFLIAGQSGNGKSSILHNITITFPKQLENFDFHYLDGREVFLYDDIDIIDILLMIGYRIVKESQKLTKRFQEELIRIEKIHDGARAEERSMGESSERGSRIDAKGSIGASLLHLFSSKLGFEASYRNNESARKLIREFFQIKKNELIELINEIILAYKTERESEKPLVMVIDDLEKKSDVDNIFKNDLYLLKQVEMIKIITVPIYLKRDHYFADSDIREFSLALRDRKGQEIPKSFELLKEVIHRRLEDQSLIEEEAVDLAIRGSGGNLRQLIKQVHFAAEIAYTYEAEKIRTEDMKEAQRRIIRDLSSLVMPKARFLDYIRQHKMIDSEDEEHQKLLAEATRSGLIFAYFNGITWYDVNPLIEKAIDEYLNEA